MAPRATVSPVQETEVLEGPTEPEDGDAAIPGDATDATTAPAAATIRIPRMIPRLLFMASLRPCSIRPRSIASIAMTNGPLCHVGCSACTRPIRAANPQQLEP